jgi:hypothetical protein
MSGEACEPRAWSDLELEIAPRSRDDRPKLALF